MAILNFGSINIDTIFQTPKLPAPGETVFGEQTQTGLGGKGANHSVAIARLGGQVKHLGAIGASDEWLKSALADDGIDVSHLHVRQDQQTGKALVFLGEDSENSIVVLPGANQTMPEDEIQAAVASMEVGDWLLVQNETNNIAFGIETARKAGLKVALAAAPFSAKVVVPLLEKIDLLAVNQIEFEQLCDFVGKEKIASYEIGILVTLGAMGADFYLDENVHHEPAVDVSPVDTTGAGDTFFGAFLAEFFRSGDNIKAMRFAALAAAIQVTRLGAADAIPTLDELETKV